MYSSQDLIRRAELFPSLHITLNLLVNEFSLIPMERKRTLSELTQFVKKKVEANQKACLNFICTHNSRRSHVAQIWAKTAAHYFNTPNVECFSGGVETTAFNQRAVKAMRDVGFDIAKIKEGDNPVYEVRFPSDAAPIISFSKKYDDSFNPNKDFAAIMTCTHADENCPLVLGASVRIAITYDDPKDFDGTNQEEAKYKERVDQIGREILYAFSQVKL